MRGDNDTEIETVIDGDEEISENLFNDDKHHT